VRFRIGISYGPERGPYPHYAAAVRAAADRLKLDVETVDLSDPRATPKSLDGIVFTGGGDINPERFGKGDEADRVSGVDDDRDSFEFRLLEAAQSRELPIFGICRGAQLINVGFGGDLITHIPNASAHVKTQDGKDARHEISVRKNSLIGNLTSEKRAHVNSSHHQAVGRLADAFKPTAQADDGTVEAFERADETGKPFLVAVQWHPERMQQDEPLAGSLFELFLSSIVARARVSCRR